MGKSFLKSGRRGRRGGRAAIHGWTGHFTGNQTDAGPEQGAGTSEFSENLGSAGKPGEKKRELDAWALKYF